MESCFPGKQKIIQTQSHVFQIIQLTKNILEDDGQYF